MNNKERYINFIVDDLVNKTKIDYTLKKVSFPFMTAPLSYPIYTFFPNHVIKKYGARDEEIEIIWGMYKERINKLIGNKL